MAYTFADNLTAEEFLHFFEQAPVADIFQDPRWAIAAAPYLQSMQPILCGVKDESGSIHLAAVVYRRQSKLFGDYLFIQHGPIFSAALTGQSLTTAADWGEFPAQTSGLSEVLQVFLAGLKTFAIAQKSFALTLEPLSTKDSALTLEIRGHGFLQEGKSSLPRYPLFIDLKKEETELTASLSKNTRYYVNYAKKQGVTIEFNYSPSLEKIREFHTLLLEMSDAKGYDTPSLSYFEELARQFQGTDKILVAIARQNGEAVSANFTQFSGSWAGSYYTANSRRFQKLRASYLLKWETILEAKRHGKLVFDMWGHVPGLPSGHPEAGYGQFKLGFNPIQKEFAGRLTLPIDPLRYRLWKFAGQLRALAKRS